MASSRTEIRTYALPGFDGAALAVHEMGEEDARPLLLLHGLFSNAETNWIKYGHAETIAAAGFRVIMPDLRAHGMSDAPHGADAYPDAVLVKDAQAVIAALALDDFDLCGFSLGARTTVAVLAAVEKPRRAILAGMGLEGLRGWSGRSDFFIEAIDRRDTIKRDDPHFMAVMFMKTMKVDPVAARLLLQAKGSFDIDGLTAVDLPVAVICGTEDRDNGSPHELVAVLPDARLYEIPCTHMSCVARPELGQAIRDFLTSS